MRLIGGRAGEEQRENDCCAHQGQPRKSAGSAQKETSARTGRGHNVLVLAGEACRERSRKAPALQGLLFQRINGQPTEQLGIEIG